MEDSHSNSETEAANGKGLKCPQGEIEKERKKKEEGLRGNEKAEVVT